MKLDELGGGGPVKNFSKMAGCAICNVVGGRKLQVGRMLMFLKWVYQAWALSLIKKD
jgi:hypothetical protein